MRTVPVADFVSAQAELQIYAATAVPVTITWKAQKLSLSANDEAKLLEIMKLITDLQKAGRDVDIRQDSGVYLIVAK